MAQLAGALDCPFCAHRFALSSDALRDLARYQAAVHSALGHADEHHQHAATWQQIERQTRVSTPSALLAFGVGMGLLVLLAMALQFGMVAGVVPTAVVPWVLNSGALLVVASTIVVSAWMSAQARKGPQRAEAGSARVACPSCGAPSTLKGGSVVETCGHCRAALVPSHTVMHKVVDRVRLQARAAAMDRYRAERRGIRAMASFHFGPSLPYILTGAPLPITGLCVIAAMGRFLFGDGNPLPLVATIAAASLNVALLTGVHAWRVSHRRRWHQVAADLATQFRGQAAARPIDGTTQWLNAYWASAYDLRHLYPGPYHTSAVLDACGYPALLDLNPIASGARGSTSWMHILIAAAIPDELADRQAPPPPAANASLHWLEAAGFQVTIERSGLLAAASPATLAHLRRRPETAHVLSTVVTTLAGLANALGAAPATAVP